MQWLAQGHRAGGCWGQECGPGHGAPKSMLLGVTSHSLRNWGRAGTWARAPLSRANAPSALPCAPVPCQGVGLLHCRRGALQPQPGPQFFVDAMGGQEVEPQHRGPLSACRWAGRSGLCGQAQGPVSCKLISRLLRPPRRQEQLQGRAPARKGEPHQGSR